MAFSGTASLVALAVLSLPATAAAQSDESISIEHSVIEARLREAPNDNTKRWQALHKMFEDAGCREQLADHPVKGSKLPNVTCTLPGSSGSVILVGAHYDHVRKGEGVADNWTGAALLPSLYESLRGSARKHTFVFVGFTDEERGLVGSRFYAKQLTAEQKAKTRAMVNLDTLGLSPSKIWHRHSDPKLVQALLEVAAGMKLPVSDFNFKRGSSTDSESFAKYKIARVTIHSITKVTYPILHTARDNQSAIKLPEYYDSYRLVAAYLAFLDATLE